MKTTNKKLIPIVLALAALFGVGSALAVIYSLGTSAPVTGTVNDSTQTITPTILINTPSITIGQSFTLTAQCTANWPNKPVSFYDGATLLQTVNTDASGIASITVTPTTLGVHSYTAGS